jgi:hypothetical protein
LREERGRLPGPPREGGRPRELEVHVGGAVAGEAATPPERRLSSKRIESATLRPKSPVLGGGTGAMVAERRWYMSWYISRTARGWGEGGVG